MYAPEVAHCTFCGAETKMTGTKLCDFCWELSRRIGVVRRPLLEKILFYYGYKLEQDADR